MILLSKCKMQNAKWKLVKICIFIWMIYNTLVLGHKQSILQFQSHPFRKFCVISRTTDKLGMFSVGGNYSEIFGWIWNWKWKCYALTHWIDQNKMMIELWREKMIELPNRVINDSVTINKLLLKSIKCNSLKMKWNEKKI